jgi:hypothetical protein
VDKQEEQTEVLQENSVIKRSEIPAWVGVGCCVAFLIYALASGCQPDDRILECVKLN